MKGMRRTRRRRASAAVSSPTMSCGKVWRQAEANGTFGALIRVLLLIAQRRGAVVGMRWSDIKDNVTPKDGDKPVDGVWEVATAAREKGNFGAAKLPARRWRSSRRSQSSRAIPTSSPPAAVLDR